MSPVVVAVTVADILPQLFAGVLGATALGIAVKWRTEQRKILAEARKLSAETDSEVVAAARSVAAELRAELDRRDAKGAEVEERLRRAQDRITGFTTKIVELTDDLLATQAELIGVRAELSLIRGPQGQPDRPDR